MNRAYDWVQFARMMERARRAPPDDLTDAIRYYHAGSSRPMNVREAELCNSCKCYHTTDVPCE